MTQSIVDRLLSRRGIGYAFAAGALILIGLVGVYYLSPGTLKIEPQVALYCPDTGSIAFSAKRDYLALGSSNVAAEWTLDGNPIDPGNDSSTVAVSAAGLLTATSLSQSDSASVAIDGPQGAATMCANSCGTVVEANCNTAVNCPIGCGSEALVQNGGSYSSCAGHYVALLTGCQCPDTACGNPPCRCYRAQKCGEDVQQQCGAGDTVRRGHEFPVPTLKDFGLPGGDSQNTCNCSV